MIFLQKVIFHGDESTLTPEVSSAYRPNSKPPRQIFVPSPYPPPERGLFELVKGLKNEHFSWDLMIYMTGFRFAGTVFWHLYRRSVMHTLWHLIPLRFVFRRDLVKNFYGKKKNCVASYFLRQYRPKSRFLTPYFSKKQVKTRNTLKCPVVKMLQKTRKMTPLPSLCCAHFMVPHPPTLRFSKRFGQKLLW